MDKQRKREMKQQWREGQRDKARAALPLPFDELQAMFARLDVELARHGCDHTRRLTRQWLEAHGHDAEAVFTWLDSLGASATARSSPTSNSRSRTRCTRDDRPHDARRSVGRRGFDSRWLKHLNTAPEKGGGFLMPFSDFVSRWWPLPRSLDLVKGPTDLVASAVLAEVTRFLSGEELSSYWVPFESMTNLFGSIQEFTNVPTVFFVLPTHSDWSVLWNNSFGCDGYDSLCWCLTNHHGLATIHWYASDEDSVFQAGSGFTARPQAGSGLEDRIVSCSRNDARWVFDVSGEPLPEEDVATYYTARRKRDRLDERGIMALFSRLGARPWEDSFYREGKAFRIERVSSPSTVSPKTFAEFACKRRP